jgi:hypothetical protein
MPAGVMFVLNFSPAVCQRYNVFQYIYNQVLFAARFLSLDSLFKRVSAPVADGENKSISRL